MKPNSKKQTIQTAEDGSLVVSIKSPPIDGKANEELIKLLAAEFQVTKSSIRIKAGQLGRQKRIEIEM